MLCYVMLCYHQYLRLFQIIQNFEVRYNGPVIEPVLNTVMTPDQPVKLRFIPRK